MGNAVDPRLVAELLGLAEQPDACLDDALDLLSASPALARAVVRIGNSELCGMPGRITGTRRAVLILGPARVAALASAALAADHSAGTPLARRLLVGTLAEEIARAAEIGSPASALAAGVLHDGPAEWGLPHALREIAAHLGEPLRAPDHIRVRTCTVASALRLLDQEPDGETLAVDLGVLPRDLPALRLTAERSAKELERLLAGQPARES